MKRFKLLNAGTVSEAASMLADYSSGEALVISGGTDLVGTLKSDILPAYPKALINLKSIPGLSYIKEEGGVLKVGANTTLADIAGSSIVQNKWKIFSQAASNVASPQIRNAATIGGNLCQAVRCWYYRSPKQIGRTFNCFRKGGTLCYAVAGDNRHHAILGGAVCFAVYPGDTAIALTALNATIVTNKRSLPIGDLFKVLGNNLAKDEIVTEVQVPSPAAGAKQAFIKIRQRKAIDFAIVSVATVMTVSGGNVSDASIVLGAVAPVPYRATGAENAIKGKALNEQNAIAAGEAAVNGNMPLSHNSHKVQIAKALVKRALLA